jgi:hypothetical protein
MMRTDPPTSNLNNVFEDNQTVYDAHGLSDRLGCIPPFHASGTYQFLLQLFSSIFNVSELKCY